MELKQWIAMGDESNNGQVKARYNRNEAPGHAFVHTLAAGAEFLWRPVPTPDIGIDGIIEVVGNGGGLVLVQIKCTQERDFSLCGTSIPVHNAEATLTYYRAFRIPVVLIQTNRIKESVGLIANAAVAVDLSERSCSAGTSTISWEPLTARNSRTEFRWSVSNPRSSFKDFIRGVLARWRDNPGSLRLAETLLDHAHFNEALEIIKPLTESGSPLPLAQLLENKIHRREGDFNVIQRRGIPKIPGKGPHRSEALREVGYTRLVHAMHDWCHSENAQPHLLAKRIDRAMKLLTQWSRHLAVGDCAGLDYRLYAAIVRYAILRDQESKLKMGRLAKELAGIVEANGPVDESNPGSSYFQSMRTLWRHALVTRDLAKSDAYMKKLWKPFQLKAANIRVRENVSTHSLVDTLALRAWGMSLAQRGGKTVFTSNLAAKAVAELARDLVSGCYYYPEVMFWIRVFETERDS